MFLSIFKNTVLFLFIPFISCGSETAKNITLSQKTGQPPANIVDNIPPVIIGAEQTAIYLPLLQGKRIAVLGNQTSCIVKNTSETNSENSNNITYTHLIDTLLTKNINVVKAFAPEHGFRGKADASETVLDGKDTKTGLPIISLYGKYKKPSTAMLSGIDIVVFDIQDVGARFYTYISTLHYLMQACAENNIAVLVLDRPNPNGHYIDGPTLEIEHQSFVGMHPIPLVHGMTIGEYAKMVNGEGWLGANLKCDLQVIPLQNYTHQTSYSVPIKPSPNLPNDMAINLYPSLGFFEGTTINAGRGTEMQFQIFGSPYLPETKFPFNYTPKPNDGAKHPKEEGKLCHGLDLRETPKMDQINLQWLIEAYNNSAQKATFFKKASFTIHAGTEKLQHQIEGGMSSKEIRAGWQENLEKFKTVRKKYLMYDE